MTRSRTLAAVGAVAIGAGVLAAWLFTRESDTPAAAAPVAAAAARTGRPSAPPVDRAAHVRPPELARPTMPHGELRALYDRAKAEGRPPGEAAFRGTISKLMEVNRETAAAKAAKEGVTLAEMEELTFVGHMVLATQRAEDLEELTGRPLGEAERAKLGELMSNHSNDFKAKLRDAVARNATEAERWELIRGAEEAYKQSLFKLTGMNAALLDDLLAGDIAKPGAPIATQLPDTVEQKQHVPDQPRPKR